MAKADFFIDRTVQSHNDKSTDSVYGEASDFVNEASQKSRSVVEKAQELLAYYKKDYSVRLLRDHGISCNLTWTKLELRQRIRTAVLAGQVSLNSILEILTEIEKWRSLYLLFFKVPEQKLVGLRNQKEVESQIEKLFPGASSQNLLQPEIPESPEISLVQIKSHKFEIELIFKRTWWERYPDEDITEKTEAGKIHRTAKIEREARSVSFIEIDLQSGLLIFSIPQASNKSTFDMNLSIIKNTLKEVVDIDSLAQIDLASVTDYLREMSGVFNRQIYTITKEGTVSNFTSANRKADILEDYQAVEAIATMDIHHGHGNYYFQENDVVETELHFKVLPNPSRLGIFGQRKEQEVRHVIDLVRKAIKL